jgi:hypothetical protein
MPITPEDFLTGRWKNELGSEVDLRAAKGQLTGLYETRVSGGEKINETPLLGTYRDTPDGVFITIIVQWTYVKDGQRKLSQTTWNGKAFYDSPTFSLTWLLVRDTTKEDYWEATLTGVNTFQRMA